MPEALETWPVGLLQHVLPRHLEIIFRINAEFLAEAEKRRPGDMGFLARLSLIDEHGERRVRHGQPVGGGQPHDQWRLGPALGSAGENALCGLRQSVAGALHQHDQTASRRGAGCRKPIRVWPRCSTKTSGRIGATTSTSSSRWK